MENPKPHPPFLPSSRQEMNLLGWQDCDIILISGDAYVDHPAFGIALIGRYLESLGYRVGIIPQPDLAQPEELLELGRPRLFFGISSGAMDSMVNHYTSLGRRRANDDYSEGGQAGKRPDRALLKYINALQALKLQIPLIIGGIEASLRRVSHYDFWSDSIRKSLLLDSKADLLVYGMGESAIREIARRITAQEDLSGIRGTAIYLTRQSFKKSRFTPAVWLPSHAEVTSHPEALLEMTRLLERESNPENARILLQEADSRILVIFPPPPPLSQQELDGLYQLPFARRPHPRYQKEIPAFNMIKESITAVRGCGGGCSFCALGLHQGKIIQSRSPQSVLAEATRMAQAEDFPGVISDVGGPTANLYGLGCDRPEASRNCRKNSCLFPEICSHFKTDHREYLALLKALRRLPGIKQVFIASGIRFDVALRDERFLKELVGHYISGHLKVAPEHESPELLRKMRKAPAKTYRLFKTRFRSLSQKAGKEYYLVPYYIAGFPGCREKDMRNLEASLRREGIRPQQVQVFLPTPMTMATAMYYAERDPKTQAPIYVAKSIAEKKAQLDCLLYYHPPAGGLRPEKKEHPAKIGTRQRQGRRRTKRQLKFR